MAELRCNDNTVIQISDETEKELRKAFGKPEPTFKIGDIFWRGEAACFDNHYLQLSRRDNGFVELINIMSKLTCPTSCSSVNGARAVNNLEAITFAEVRSMTIHPAGLRYVPTNHLCITEKRKSAE